MPGAKRGKAYKFARPFEGPYRMVALYDNGADVTHVDKPQSSPIRVALNRVRRCPREIPDPSNEPAGRDGNLDPSFDVSSKGSIPESPGPTLAVGRAVFAKDRESTIKDAG